jgi:RimJ/RimL family protein N-acetyltransferase
MQNTVPEIRLETQRLVLRIPSASDFDGWCELMADEEASRFIGGIQARPVVWRTMAAMVGAWHLRGFSQFSVIEKASGRWVGRAGPWQPEGWPGPEIGWALLRSAWGKGFASEAASATIDWAFSELGWSDVIHCIHPDNARSIALAGRLGSKFRTHARLPPPLDDASVLVFGQSKADWFARSRSNLSH